MRELEAILNAWRLPATRREDAILATVVHVKGSAYRRPGARMLILSDGRRVGTISGGCLESSVAQKAAWWTATTGTTVRHFDTTREDAAWEFGLGCQGVISVLLERGDNPRVRQTLEFLEELQRERRPGIVATVIRSDGGPNPTVGDRLYWEAGIPRGGELAGSAFEVDLLEAVRETAVAQVSRLVQFDGFDVFVEWVTPPQSLVIFGAGHDVIPVQELARVLGWTVTIADTRPGYARPERFPGADQVIALSRGAEINQVEITPESAVVVMTHNFTVDQLLLPQILERNPRYLGLLGPRSRAERLFHDLGRDLDDYDVHAPVGLDLGGDSPQAIALAIISEIQSVLHERSARPLRERTQAIHQPALEVRAGTQPVLTLGQRTERVVCETFLVHPPV